MVIGSIRNRLLLGFGTLIFVLLINIVLTQIASRESTATYEELRTEIVPTITMLDEYREVNKELFLLSLNKVFGQTDEQYTNRMKAITEVVLPHFKTKVFLLTQNIPLNDKKIKISKDIIELSNRFITIVKEINNILLTKVDYDNTKKISQVTQKANLDLSDISVQIDNNLSLLQKEYNTRFDAHQAALSQELDNLSGIIFLIGIIGILLGLGIASGIINSIVRPINALQTSALQLSNGNFDVMVQTKGKDELSLLGHSFNNMAESLQKNFEEIKRKNKELEQFVYIASHDLQEPLRTLSSFTKLLEKEYPMEKDENSSTYVRFINEATKRMSRLVKGLLDYSRIGATKELSEVDCNTLIMGVEDDLALTIGDTETILTIGNLPTIKGYTTELRLLFQNLISNAIKFRAKNRSPHISISAEIIPGFWKFSVKDNGIGIENQYHERIFAIFQRLHNQSEYKGTGIGLAHCRKVVEMHGGKIWVESIPTVGSTFYFTISNKQ